jgi:hypothetical protein
MRLRLFALLLLAFVVACGHGAPTVSADAGAPHKLGSGSGPSPVCVVNGSAVPQTVTAGSTVTIALASTSGAQYWSVAATSTDELNATAAINSTLTINATTKTATFTAPSTLGSAVIFTSIVGVSQLGYDQNFQSQPSYTTTFKVNVAAGNGNDVMAFNEGLEQNPIFGWIVLLNPLLRGAGGGGGGGGGTLTIINVTAPNSGGITASIPANRRVQVDCTLGPVVLNFVALTSGQEIDVKVLAGDPSAHNVTVNPASGTLENPPGIGSGPESYASSVVLNSAAFKGTTSGWYSDGTSALRLE